MILGIGNDIVSVQRIENLLDKFGEIINILTFCIPFAMQNVKMLKC